MRARINGETVLPDNHAVITVQVPLAELKDYGQRLKALTSGEGVYTMEFSHYEPAPTKLQQDLVAAYRRRHTEENEQ